MSPRNTGRRVYSYTRFSSKPQEEGDSERRQLDAAEKYAKSKGYHLDESLRMIDRGLSGYHGVHRKKGALGAFLEKVKAGEVEPGSILLVENLDRLGREKMGDALKTVVFGLLSHDIIIETLSPRYTFTKASLNDADIYVLVGELQRAYRESERKSQLAQTNWQQKRKFAREKVLTGRGPAWLRLVNDKWEIIPEAAETIRMIFKLKLEGFGKLSTERTLNETATWFPESRKQKTHGWRSSYIEKILRTRAVIGEFQPHRLNEMGKRVPEGEPIKGYFPAVVDPNTFYAVQECLARNKGKGGRTGKARNVFQNLVRCGYCGGPMVFVDRGPAPKGGRYLVCDNGRRGTKLRKADEDGNEVEFKCSSYSVRYPEFETTTLDNLSKLRVEHVLPKSGERAKQQQSLRSAVAAKRGELEEVERKMENLVDHMAECDDRLLRPRLEKKYSDLNLRKQELGSEQERLQAALRELEKGEQSFEKWQRDLAGLKKAITEDINTRIKLKAHLKEFISKIEVFAKGNEEEVLRAEAMLEEAAPELLKVSLRANGKKERGKIDVGAAFRSYMRKRILSVDGRCYRLFLRSSRPNSTGLALAPSTSLASSVSIKPGKDDWRMSTPKLDKLFEEFFDGRKPGLVPKASALSTVMGARQEQQAKAKRVSI